MDYSTGSVGLGATAPLWGAIAARIVHERLGTQVSGRQIALIGDAELDEGAIWEAVADPMAPARRGAVGRRPEPPVARPGRPRHGLRAAARDVRGRRLAGHHGQVRPPSGGPLRAAGRAGAAPPDRLDDQRGVPAPAAARPGGAARAAARPGQGPPRAREAGPGARGCASCATPCGASAGTTSAPCSTPTGPPTPPRTARRSSSPTRSRAGRCRSRATRRTTPRC